MIASRNEHTTSIFRTDNGTRDRSVRHRITAKPTAATFMDLQLHAIFLLAPAAVAPTSSKMTLSLCQRFLLILYPLLVAAVPVKIFVVGKVTSGTARLLLELGGSGQERLALEGPAVTLRSGLGRVIPSDDDNSVRMDRLRFGRPTVFAFTGLTPSTHYTVEFNQGLSFPYPAGFRTFQDSSATASESPLKIAAVSCNKHRILANLSAEGDLWNDIYGRAGELDVLLHLGDQVSPENRD